jgi:hypothetical protein
MELKIDMAHGLEDLRVRVLEARPDMLVTDGQFSSKGERTA